jgi:hypothetical protein
MACLSIVEGGARRIIANPRRRASSDGLRPRFIASLEEGDEPRMTGRAISRSGQNSRFSNVWPDLPGTAAREGVYLSAESALEPNPRPLGGFPSPFFFGELRFQKITVRESTS